VKNNTVSVFKPKKIKNFNPKKVNFYTFHSGFKKRKEDLLVAVFDKAISVAAIYSLTSTPSAPIIWDKKNNRGLCKVLIVNSGNANAHTGNKGIKAINQYAKIASKKFNCSLEQILVSSTGVIGEQLDPKKIIDKLEIIHSSRKKNLLSAAKAIMTTDTYPKTIIQKVKYRNKEILIFGLAKGSGMIAPNMGTMLAYIFIDANLSKSQLQKLLHQHVDTSFNSITVDSDTSTNDTLMLFALNNKKMKKIDNNIFLKKLSFGLQETMLNLAKQVVCDGEGITKMIEITVLKAKNSEQALSVAFSVANSPLVKTAVAGQDPNWGRVIMAIGKSYSQVIQNKIKLSFGKFLVAKNGEIYPKINIKKLDAYMKNKVIKINIELGLGSYTRTVYSTDFTHEYVRINSDYRS